MNTNSSIDTSKHHIISSSATVKQALIKLNMLSGKVLTLFVVDENDVLIGSITDGDIRRYLIEAQDMNIQVTFIMKENFEKLQQDCFTLDDIDRIRKKGIQLLPVIDAAGKYIELIDISHKRSLLPIEAVIMAGGEGQRLRPFTASVPKPMLHIGHKPILEHNVDRLISYGVRSLHISLRYLGQQIVDYFGDGRHKGVSIKYAWEKDPRGTLGALKQITSIRSDTILVMNSDLLTTIDFEDFYRSFHEQNADMSIASIPYKVKVPYAVLQTDKDNVLSLEEKPTYTYYSNAGIYFIKKELVQFIPSDTVFHATDLIEHLIQMKKKVISYPILNYWLDIGNPDDFAKAQEDILHLKP